jgi:hypothetical protein
MYYFYEPYAMVVFGQSVAVFSSALLLTFLKFRYSRDARTASCAPHLNIRLASTFIEHIAVLSMYIVLIYVLLMIGFAVLGRSPAIAVLGLLGNLLDTIISFPLFVRIVLQGKVHSISSVLILQYILGDFAKVFTFMIVATPWVFRLGAYAQCCVDGLMSINFFRLIHQGKGRSDYVEIATHPDADVV